MARVKICGMMCTRDVFLAQEAGAEGVGFVTEYPVPVPWNLSREEAGDLIRKAPPFVTTVAVVGGPPGRMLEIALSVRPTLLQLHGDETLEEIQEVVRGLEGTGIGVIKALRVNVDTGLACFEETDPIRAGKALAGSGIRALVVDSKTSSMPAGTGVSLDWEMAARMVRDLDLPVILAGGLSPGNVAEAVNKVKPYAVDVITGVEAQSGVKDPVKMKEFVAAAKGIKREK